MRLIFDSEGRAVGTATDSYSGPGAWAPVPETFDPTRLTDYRLVEGEAHLLTLTQFEKDEGRYMKRAAVKDDLIAYMAADNMSRVRAGVWSVPQLMGLMNDPAIASANAYMSTLSYELAAQSISDATSTLLTPEIRANWISKLQEHFYLEG